MYKDAILWAKIRKRYYFDKVSKRQILRETGIHCETLKKILEYPFPLNYVRKKNPYSDKEVEPSIEISVRSAVNTIIQYLALTKITRESKNRQISLLIEELQKFGYCKNFISENNEQETNPHLWITAVIQNMKSEENIRRVCGEIEDIKLFLEKAINGNLRDRNRAVTILSHYKGITFGGISRLLHISKTTAARYWKQYKCKGGEGLFDYTKPRKKRSDDKLYKEKFFSIFHSPPSSYDINRTTWKLKDLKMVLEDEGLPMCKDTIGEILSSEGYKWRKAKIVLTSNDPQYKEKILKINNILRNLRENDRFFSIDEFGPFSIKIKAGKRLVGPNEYPSVPQFQKSKGFLILTAALELSRNQVTHFYSKKKNTKEMIKLLNLLLDEYKECDNLYLSWDSASWHISKELNKYVNEINIQANYKKNTPHVDLAPLPASAQFLNVIESVFSGMAKAIIHNSNYKDVNEAKTAIDRYFKERNHYYKKNPKRAGKKIWKEELVASIFNDGQNCKNPKWNWVA